MDSLIGLALTLPGQATTPRTRAWRTLKALGAAVLRDGLYVLPASDVHEDRLAALGEDIRQAGGTADLLALQPRDEEQVARFRALFDRGAEYAEILVAARACADDLARDDTNIERRLKVIRRQAEQVIAIDFFPGEAHAQVLRELDELDRRLIARRSPDEPHFVQAPVERQEIAAYQGRLWATRARPKIDRLASAWLIARHIDTHATFRWLATPADCPPDSLGFDFDGAKFTHTGGLVTFEMLLATFGLDTAPSLRRIATIVHYLDVGGVPVPEAAGFGAVLDGLRATHTDDDRLLAAALPVFDALHTHFASRQDATP